MLGSLVLQASVIHAAVKGFQGQRVSFGNSLAVALKYLLPILGFSFLFILAVMLGFLLLIIPYSGNNFDADVVCRDPGNDC